MGSATCCFAGSSTAGPASSGSLIHFQRDSQAASGSAGSNAMVPKAQSGPRLKGPTLPPALGAQRTPGLSLSDILGVCEVHLSSWSSMWTQVLPCLWVPGSVSLSAPGKGERRGREIVEALELRDPESALAGALVPPT